jgi:hypothetical protein
MHPSLRCIAGPIRNASEENIASIGLTTCKVVTTSNASKDRTVNYLGGQDLLVGDGHHPEAAFNSAFRTES